MLTAGRCAGVKVDPSLTTGAGSQARIASQIAFMWVCALLSQSAIR